MSGLKKQALDSVAFDQFSQSRCQIGKILGAEIYLVAVG